MPRRKSEASVDSMSRKRYEDLNADELVAFIAKIERRLSYLKYLLTQKGV